MSTEERDEPTAQPLPREGDVWYVSHGSNMSELRLSAYIEGGVPPGGNRANPGARDDSPPRRSVPVDLPGALFFADIAAQEMYRVPQKGDPLVEVVIGGIDGVPMLLFTAPHGIDHV